MKLSSWQQWQHGMATLRDGIYETLTMATSWQQFPFFV